MQNEPIHTEEYKGLTIKIYPDDNVDLSDDFTDYETAGWHTFGSWSRYDLFQVEGKDYQWHQHIFNTYNAEILAKYPSLSFSSCLEDYEDPDYTGAPYDRDNAEALIDKWINAELEYLPVYVYEHGGITMNTGGFSCPWDSGQAGFIFASHAEIKERYQAKKCNKALEVKARQHMKDWIEYLATICEGSVYGYVIEDETGEQLDSCWGYVERTYLIEKTHVYQEAKDIANWHYQDRMRKHIEKKKAEIVYRVPLQARTA